MVTQKDIHNDIVKNTSDWQKICLSIQLGGDVEKIKEYEQSIANIINEVVECLQNSGVEYLNKVL